MNNNETIYETDFCPLTVGDTIPDIEFQVFHNNEIKDTSLDKFRKKWLVLFFYPGDFTFVCPTELGELAGMYDSFKKEDVEIVSVSPDSVFAHKMWHETSETIKNIGFPMAADVKDELSTVFGTYCDNGTTHRGTFIIDPEGVIKSIEINDSSIGRSSNELLRRVMAAKFVNKHTGSVCPASWNVGDKVLNPDVDLIGKI